MFLSLSLGGEDGERRQLTPRSTVRLDQLADGSGGT